MRLASGDEAFARFPFEPLDFRTPVQLRQDRLDLSAFVCAKPVKFPA